MNQTNFAKRVLITVSISLLLIGIVALLVYAFHFFLLVFAGILLAVLFRAGTSWLTHKTRIKRWLSSLILILFFSGLITITIVLMAPTFAEQVREMQEKFPESINALQEQVSRYEWGRVLMQNLEDNLQDFIPETERALKEAHQVFSTTMGVIADFFIILFMAIFFAVNPHMYRTGIVKLFPVKHRERISGLIMMSYWGLSRWLVGKFAAMIFVGFLTWLGLYILGVPFAFGLAVIAFLFDFIPTIGPLIAAIPAILVAFLVDFETVLWVTGIYIVVQSLESYVITPIAFKKSVEISPAMTIGSIIFFGIVAGPLGIILATPLVAVIKIWVNELYVKDYLESKRSEIIKE